MKILAFAGSSSKKSINKALVTHAANVLKATYLAEADVTVLDLNDFEMPIYSADYELDNGVPPQAQQFLDDISGADALLISYAEHNGSYSAAFKNVFDWASRIQQKVYQDKPAVLMATSPGPGGAKNVLQSAVASAPHFRATVIDSLSVPGFGTAFDVEAGKLTDEGLAQKLSAAMEKLATHLST